MHDEGKKMEEIRVDYLVKYTGVSNPDIENGKVYKCVAEWYDEKKQLHDLSSSWWLWGKLSLFLQL